MFLAFSTHIWHVIANEELVILDARKNKFFLFNKNQTKELVKALESSTYSDSVSDLIADGVIVESDIQQKLYYSYAQGLDDFTWSESMRYKTKCYPYRARTRDFLNAFIALARACFAIHTGRLTKVLESDINRPTVPTDLQYEVIAREISSLTHAARYFPSKIACLEYSVALQYRLERHGIRGLLVIGIQKYSFMSHAWLEICGQLLGEPSYVSKSLHRLRR